MVAIGMNPMPLKVIGVKACLQLDVIMGCQRILDPIGAQTFEVRRSQKKQWTLWKWEMKVCIVIDMMAIAWDNELKFQRLLVHHPF
jgi:hypothetical protein